MAEKTKNKDTSKVEKKLKKSKKSSKHEKAKDDKIQRAAASAFSLLANDKSLDPTLSSLFAVKQPPVKAKPVLALPTQHVDGPDADDIDEDEIEAESDGEIEEPSNQVTRESVRDLTEKKTTREAPGAKHKRKRRSKDGDDDDEEDLEGAYMQRLAREEGKEAERVASQRLAKRNKVDTESDDEELEDGLIAADITDDLASESESGESVEESGGAEEEEDDDDEIEDDEDAALSPPPRHETEVAADNELAKANRTVFLGNVSTAAISSKSSRKTLLHHLASFFESLAASKKDDAKHKVESIRFRSTPYASAIPKKAAFAKKEVMDATTKSTNAYAVYSSPVLAREAVKRLNGTVVLGRHLRVDQVAHPAQTDHRRCVFVGNLGFVDDESNILKADEEEGREKRKQGKEPADIEEGLWRTFGKCGTVESVRVIRDSTTRVGKGIAYVQFEDENAVEAALLYNDKKFPPMLPRKLRVSRAKAQKRNAKPGSGRPTSRPNTNGYQRKITAEESSRAGRAGKLLGRAGAARVRNPEQNNAKKATGAVKTSSEFKKPEDFIFEGHRATSKQGKAGLKLGGRNKKGKVTKRSASFRTTKRKT